MTLKPCNKKNEQFQLNCASLSCFITKISIRSKLFCKKFAKRDAFNFLSEMFFFKLQNFTQKYIENGCSSLKFGNFECDVSFV